MRAAGPAPGIGSRQLAAGEPERDRIGRELPIGGGGQGGVLGRDAGQLAIGQGKVDPPAGQVEGVAAELFEHRKPEHGAVPLRAGEQAQRIAPGGEVAPVDGDPPGGPDPVIAPHPDPVGHDPVRLAGVAGGILDHIVDDRPAHGEHLGGIAELALGPEIVE